MLVGSLSLIGLAAAVIRLRRSMRFTAMLAGAQ
jgi:hypothetical protein